MYKTRTKLVVEAHGGICNGWDKEEMDCNTQECSYPSKFEKFYARPNQHVPYTFEYFQKIVFGDLGQSIQIVTKPVEVVRCTKQGQSLQLKLMEECAMVGIRMKWIVILRSVLVSLNAQIYYQWLGRIAVVQLFDLI